MKRHRRALQSEPPSVGGRPPLINKEKIVEAALRMGVDNLSMHGLARELGVSTTALYRYVASREALLDECMDTFCARVSLPDAGLPWDRYLLELGQSFRVALKRTPGASAYGIKIGPTTPAAFTIVEYSLAVLIRDGFSPLGAFQAYGLVLDHVFTFVQKEEQLVRLEEENGQYGYKVLQLSEDELEQFPNLEAALNQMLPPDFEQSYARQANIIVNGLKPG